MAVRSKLKVPKTFTVVVYKDNGVSKKKKYIVQGVTTRITESEEFPIFEILDSKKNVVFSHPAHRIDVCYDSGVTAVEEVSTPKGALPEGSNVIALPMAKSLDRA